MQNELSQPRSKNQCRQQTRHYRRQNDIVRFKKKKSEKIGEKERKESPVIVERSREENAAIETHAQPV